MTLRDLIDSLTELAEEHGDDVEVRLAHQPNWPLEYAIGEVAAAGPDADEDEDDDEDGEPEAADDDDAETVIYIGEGQQLGYLGGAASRALGWGRR